MAQSNDQPGANGADAVSAGRVIALLLLAALAVRISFALALPHIIHPDETFQVLEPAWWLLTGERIVAWEWRGDVIRSWLWPLIASVFAWPFVSVSGGSANVFVFAVKLLSMVISLLGVWAAYAIGRMHSMAHGLAGAGVLAFWYEFVAYSGHPLNEVAAGSVCCALVGWGCAQQPGVGGFWPGWLWAPRSCCAFSLRRP